MFFLASGALSGLFAIAGLFIIAFLPLYFFYERLHSYSNYLNSHNKILHWTGILLFKLGNILQAELLLCKWLFIIAGIKLLWLVFFGN